MCTSIDRRWVAGLVAAGTLLVGLLVGPPRAQAATVDACVRKSNGTARFVKKTTKCKKGETKISWNTVGPAGKDGTNGTNGAAGSTGVEGKAGPEGPSEVYEVELSATPSFQPPIKRLTLTLPNLPPGAYAIFGKAEIVPEEEDIQSSSCELAAGAELDLGFVPMEKLFVVALSTELTHTFTTTGSVSLTCGTFVSGYTLGAAGTRIVAIRVDSQVKTTATATT